MKNLVIEQLTAFSVETIIAALLVLGLLRLRSRIGLSPLYVMLGVLQPIQVLLASSLYAEIIPGLVISPGSVTLFTASLAAILLIYILEDALETRKVIYGIIIANLTMSLLLYLFGYHLKLPSTLNFLGLPLEIFHQNARVMLTGTLMLLADVLLIIFVYEMINRRVRNSAFLSIYLTLATILIFDSLGFYTGAFYGQPNYLAILTSGIIGKLSMALFYAASAAIYLRFFEPKDRDTKPFQDIFHALTYRQKFELERRRGSQTEKQLIESEQKYRLLLSSQKDAIFLHKILPEGFSLFTEVNQATTRRYGFSRAELFQMSIKDICEPQALADYLADGKREKLLAQGALVFETVHVDKSGTCFPVEVSSTVVELQGENYILSTVRDISERKQSEAALVSERSILRSLIDSASDAIYIKDINGTYRCCNKASEKLIGLAEKDQIGKSDYDFFPQHFAAAIQEKDQSVFEGGQTVRVEEVLTAADGQTVTLDSIKAPIFHPDGQILGLVGISRDISASKQAEAKRLELEAQLRQKYKMEAIGIMAGGIAHDFNNILAIIMTNLELMQRKIAAEHPLLPRLEQAKAASSRAVELVKQILTYSRQGKPDHPAVELVIIVEEALKLLRSVIPASIEILTHIDASARSTMIEADSTQVEEVLINLCQNGAFAMGEKGLLSVSLRNLTLTANILCANRTVPSGRYLALEVTDTGTGMSPELLDKIFDPFFTSKPIGQGTGMGLAICHNIMKNHHGYLTVTSELGRGSTFTAYFPLAPPGAPAPAAPIPETVATTLPTGCERILLVDDEQSLTDSVGDFLAEHGYAVSKQTDSQQALDLFSAEPDAFELVITDQTMPGLTGLELTSRLLQIRPELPVILCTGYSRNLTEEKAKQQGISEFFMKPLNLPLLAQKVRKRLDRVSPEKRPH